MTQKHTENEGLGAILAQLSYNQIRFLIARADASSDIEACRMAGMSRNTVSHWPEETRSLIREGLRQMASDGIITALHMRRRSLAKAMAVKVAGLDSKREQTCQNVATEIIEWELGRATQRQEHSGPDGGPIEVDDVRDRYAQLIDRQDTEAEADGDPKSVNN